MQKISCFILHLFVCFFLFVSTITAQGKPFAKADSIARLIPAEATKTAQSLSAFISQHVSDETERIKVIYVWIAYNIAYDVHARFASVENKVLSDYENTLAKRKGVCGHYATLFHELAEGVGIKSFIVSGMVKMPDGEFASESHAWNVALIEGVWHLFDPTWGAGSVYRNTFEKRFSAKWCMTKPEEFIKTHLPFDPVWQLSNATITGNDFFKSEGPLQDSLNRFDFIDSIRAYEKQTSLERILAAAKRMRNETLQGGAAGMPEPYKMLRNRYYEMELMGGIYNAATEAYNLGIEKLNVYTSYYNRQYRPEKTYPEIQAMIDSPGKYFTYTAWLLHKIESGDKDLSEDVKQLHTLVTGAMDFLKKENAFLKLYFSTPAKKRAKLFYEKR
jgi:hypothetical protein